MAQDGKETSWEDRRKHLCECVCVHECVGVCLFGCVRVRGCMWWVCRCARLSVFLCEMGVKNVGQNNCRVFDGFSQAHSKDEWVPLWLRIHSMLLPFPHQWPNPIVLCNSED